MSAILDFFATDGFLPHGICLIWKPEVFWLHFVADSVIAVSYFAIPGALLYVALTRSDLVPRWVLALFMAFIVLCGLTHLLSVWVLWNPDYGIEGLVKAATALVSVATAASLIPAARWAGMMPSAGQWLETNARLNRQVQERRIAEDQVRALNAELETRIRARTAELQHEVEERRAAEQRFRNVAELSVDWIWETDADLRYTFITDRVEQVTGLKVSDYIGKTRIEMFGDVTGDPFLQQHIEDCLAHRPFSDVVQWLNRPRGLVCISVSGRPHFDEQGNFTGYSGVGRDVTQEQLQRRRLEDMNAALSEARDQALRASKSKSSFLAHMSHELRTPMNAILGFAEVMKEQVIGPLEDRYRAYAGHIHDSAQHLLSLINDVLDLSKIEAGAYELQESAVDLPAVGARAMRQVAGAAQDGGRRLALDMPRDLPALWADQRAVFQITLNLLTNAVKFTPRDGAVTLFARLEEGGGVAFGVRDTGIGMNEAEIAKALQRFGQVDNVMTKEQQGSGLGLPLVQELALLHGGAVSVQSEPGEGTTVTVRFGADRVGNRG